jgi:RNA polymerase sigma-B factor
MNLPEGPPDRELFARAREGDGRAREQLVERYLPLARRLARRYQRSEEPLEDLVQVASLGLLKAIDRYDTTRTTAFSSFAVPTILGELRRHFRDRTWSVRVPRELQELALQVDKTVAALSTEAGRAPTVGEIATALDASEEQVLDALQAASAYRAGSLDAPRSGAGEDTSGESLADAIGADEGGFERAEERATLGPMLAHISERERLVSRLIRQALARLREGLREDPPASS